MVLGCRGRFGRVGALRTCMDQMRTLPSLEAVARKGCPSHRMETMLCK